LFKGAPSKGNGNMVDRKHFSTIADSVRGVLESRRKFLNATLDGKGTPLSDVIYFDIECSLGELRRRMAAAGCFNLPHQHYATRKEAMAYEALRTLAREVGESSQAPVVASAPAPLLGEASARRLAAFVTAVEEFLPVPQSEPPAGSTAPPLSSKATVNARMIDILGKKPEASGWTAKQFAEQLHCSAAAVVGTNAWKSMKLDREKGKAERASKKAADKRRK
jgi:hypothetical protein